MFMFEKKSRSRLDINVQYGTLAPQPQMKNRNSFVVTGTAIIIVDTYDDVRLRTWRYVTDTARFENSMKILNELKARRIDLEVEHRNKPIEHRKVKGTRPERCSVIF